jgi:hypothetical protein
MFRSHSGTTQGINHTPKIIIFLLNNFYILTLVSPSKKTAENVFYRARSNTTFASKTTFFFCRLFTILRNFCSLATAI